MKAARTTQSADTGAGPEAGDMWRELSGLLRYLPARRRRELAFTLILMLLGGLAEMVTIGAVVPFLTILALPDGLPQWLAAAFDSIGAETSAERLPAAALVLLLAALAAALLRLLLNWLTNRMVLGLGHDLSVEIHRRTLWQPYAYHLEHNSSALVASLEKVQMLVGGVLWPILQAVAALVIACFVVVALLWIEPVATAIGAMVMLLIYLGLTSLTKGRLARNSEIIAPAYDRRVQLVQESIGGIRDVIVDQAQAAHLEAFRTVDRQLVEARIGTAMLGTAPRFVVEFAGIALLVVLALLLSSREGGLVAALPALGALALGAQRLLPLFQQFYNAWATLRGYRSLARQVNGLLQLPVDDDIAVDSALPAIPFERRISFDTVGFTYPGRTRPALKDVNVTIPRGARVALVGRTGSGKSSFIDLLMGLIEPGTGAIHVDDTRIDRTSRARWQRQIAHVPQSIFLADASIARNIALSDPSPEPDMDRVRRACALAQLGDFIDSLPDGLDTRVGERGVRLSGGQRQRLAIARAIYKQATVLVLDEATSALDEQTESAILKALETLSNQGVTVIIAAHRRSTVESCDLVIALENGRITGIESPAGTSRAIAG